MFALFVFGTGHKRDRMGHLENQIGQHARLNSYIPDLILPTHFFSLRYFPTLRELSIPNRRFFCAVGVYHGCVVVPVFLFFSERNKNNYF